MSEIPEGYIQVEFQHRILDQHTGDVIALIRSPSDVPGIVQALIAVLFPRAAPAGAESPADKDPSLVTAELQVRRES